MNRSLAAQVTDLVESLHDLRRRVRQAARYEVARTIAEALREAAMMLVCGPAPTPNVPRSPYSDWDDPWHEPMDEPWHDSVDGTVVDADDSAPRPLLRLSPSVLAGIGAARWSYTRSRQIGPAILVGLLVACAASLGGPSVQALLRAWSVANDLLSPNQLDFGR